MTTGKDGAPEQEKDARRKQEELDRLLDRLSEDSKAVLAESKNWAPVFNRNQYEHLNNHVLFPVRHAPITLLCALTTHGAAAKNVLALFDKMTPEHMYEYSSVLGRYIWDRYAKQRYGKSEVVFVSEQVQNVLTSAAKEADEAGSPLIEPHHILLALASKPDENACCYLRGHGLTYELLKQTLSFAGEITGDNMPQHREDTERAIAVLEKEEDELDSQVAHFMSLMKSAQSEIGKRDEQLRDITERIRVKTNELDALQRIEESLKAHAP